MPIYNFHCLKCEGGYEDLARFDPSGTYPGVECPACGSVSKRKVPSLCSFAFSNPVGTDRWNSDTGGHEYRFRHNLPRVIEERHRAEAASHVGPSPHMGIDDIRSGKNFGEVK